MARLDGEVAVPTKCIGSECHLHYRGTGTHPTCRKTVLLGHLSARRDAGCVCLDR